MSGLLETVKNPSPEVLDSMFKHAISVKLGGAYTWEKYMRDMYSLAVSDILDGLEEKNNKITSNRYNMTKDWRDTIEVGQVIYTRSGKPREVLSVTKAPCGFLRILSLEKINRGMYPNPITHYQRSDLAHMGYSLGASSPSKTSPEAV